MSKNKESILKNRGRLYIQIDGYNDDSREVFEIPEIRKWYSDSIEQGIPWLYFLGSKTISGIYLDGLQNFFQCTCEIELLRQQDGLNFVQATSTQKSIDWLILNNKNLAEFCMSNELAKEVYDEMYFKAARLLFSNSESFEKFKANMMKERDADIIQNDSEALS